MSLFNFSIFKRMVAFCMLAAGLVACGGGGGSNLTSSGTGNVALLLTDGPTDEFSEVNLTITQVELLGDGGHVTVFTGNKTVNLLDLANHSEPFTLTEGVPAGAYNKIRLTVTDVELVRRDADGNVIETITPVTPGHGKLDLNPRGPFSVNSGDTLVIQVDIDAEKSIHVVETGNGKYIFRPVVFVDVLGADVTGKIARVSGAVHHIDEQTQSFDLCNDTLSQRAKRADDEDEDEEYGNDGEEHDDAAGFCVNVRAGDASFFDANGDAAEFGGLTEGEQATALGHFLPPSEDDGSRHVNDDHPRLHAVVVELAPGDAFARLNGVAGTVVDAGTGQFDMTVDAGQGFTDGTVLHVKMSAGTKVYAKDGTAKDAGAIQPGTVVKVEGVVDVATDTIKAALVFVDVPDAAMEKYSGTLANMNAVAGTFTLNGASMGDMCVTTTPGTDIFLLTGTASGFTSQAVGLSDLDAGQPADVYGSIGLGGCIEADHVIATAL